MYMVGAFQSNPNRRQSHYLLPHFFLRDVAPLVLIGPCLPSPPPIMPITTDVF